MNARNTLVLLVRGLFLRFFSFSSSPPQNHYARQNRKFYSGLRSGHMVGTICPMEKAAIKKPGKIYLLEICLMDIEPRIWRKFAVRPYMRLDRLHMVIQKVMGWTNSHLHSFNAGGGVQYSYPHPGYDMNNDFEDECEFKVSDLMTKPKDRFIYEYDFGDCWEHMVELTAIEEAQKNVKYPICLAGERACPPEDSGGPWGYPELFETLMDQKNEGREEMLEWLGGNFDSESFDLDTVNRRLRR